MADVRSAPKLASPGDLYSAWMEQATWFNVSGQLGQWSAKGLQNMKPAPYLATMASFSI